MVDEKSLNEWRQHVSDMKNWYEKMEDGKWNKEFYKNNPPPKTPQHHGRCKGIDAHYGWNGICGCIAVYE